MEEYRHRRRGYNAFKGKRDGRSDKYSYSVQLKSLVKKAMIYKKWKIKKKVIGHKDWWDRSCTKKKRETKGIYRKWRKGEGTKEDFITNRIGL